jgi:hypothetical protein
VILLGLGAGLRRKEIDGLRWDQVQSEKNEVFIASHEEFEVKTADSQDAVHSDCAEDWASVEPCVKSTVATIAQHTPELADQPSGPRKIAA